MNLRKDHYRSFTRTLRTVSFFGSVRVGDDAWAPSAGVARVFASRRSRTLLRQIHKRPLWSRPSACAAIARALATDITNHTTLVSGYLGSLNDEERSEMRYLM